MGYAGCLQGGARQPELRLRLNWFKKTDRSASPVFLVDEVNSDYCYPIASSMTGEVVPGHPRTGILAFELFRNPTTKLSVHFSDVPVAKGRGGKRTFEFTYEDPDLAAMVSETLESPTLSEQVVATLDAEAERLRQHVKKQHSGCVLAAVSLMAAAITGLASVVIVALVGFGLAF